MVTGSIYLPTGSISSKTQLP